MFRSLSVFLRRCQPLQTNVRNNASFEIFHGTPKCKESSAVSVVLFGFAGSPIHQLEKMSKVYTELGYRTLYCTLPMKFTFSYDIENIKKCAEEVVLAVKKENISEVVCHSLSNNGGVLYQHFSQMAVSEPGLTIKGAVFDSSPGPIGIQNIQKYINLSSINKFRPSRQTPVFLPMHLFGVNMANRVPLAQTLSQIFYQINFFKNNWKKNKHVPWVGAYMTEKERQSWPLLFIYSKNDKLLPWRYVEEVIRVQTLTGRPVLSKLFDKSGSAGHVAHLKYHPTEYKEVVQKLLERI